MPIAAGLHGFVHECDVTVEFTLLETTAKCPPEESPEHLPRLVFLGPSGRTCQQPFLGRGPRIERAVEVQAFHEHRRGRGFRGVLAVRFFLSVGVFLAVRVFGVFRGLGGLHGRFLDGDQHPVASRQRRHASRELVGRLLRGAGDDERPEDSRSPGHGSGQPIQILLRGGLRQVLAADEERHANRLRRVGCCVDLGAQLILAVGLPFKRGIDRSEFDRAFSVGGHPPKPGDYQTLDVRTGWLRVLRLPATFDHRRRRGGNGPLHHRLGGIEIPLQ